MIVVSNSFVAVSRCSWHLRDDFSARIRNVGMLAMRATAECVRATACSRIIAGTTRRWNRYRYLRSPPGIRSPLFLSFSRGSDVRFDRFHGWSALSYATCAAERNRAYCSTVISAFREAAGRQPEINSARYIYIALMMRKFCQDLTKRGKIQHTEREREAPRRN